MHVFPSDGNQYRWNFPWGSSLWPPVTLSPMLTGVFHFLILSSRAQWKITGPLWLAKSDLLKLFVYFKPQLPAIFIINHISNFKEWMQNISWFQLFLLWWFSTLLRWSGITLGFGLTVKQNDQFKDIPLGSRKLWQTLVNIFWYFLTFYRANQLIKKNK